MKVLVACEFSGVVREAFAARGHEAWSCDLLPTEIPSSRHIQGDVLEVLDDGWDLLIGHPPCTHLAISGAPHFGRKRREQREALEFFLALLNAPISQIAVENPVSIVSSHIRPPDQIVQPWMFGHATRKGTCLWLKNLRRLKPTKVVAPKLIKMGNGKKYAEWHLHVKAGHERSRTYLGIADAMAVQWGRKYIHGFGIDCKHRLVK